MWCDCLVWWWGADAAPANGRGWERVEDAGEQASAPETRHGGDVPEYFGLDGEAEGEGRAGDVFAVATFAVDDEQVAGVAFQEHFEVRLSGIAARDGREDAALGGQHRQPTALLGEQRRGGLRGDLIRDESGHRRCGELVGGRLGVGSVVDGLGAVFGGVGAVGCAGHVGGVRVSGTCFHLRSRPKGSGVLLQCPFGCEDGRGHRGEDRRLAASRREGDDHEQVGRLAPARPDFDHGPSAGCSGQARERQAAGQVGRCLGEIGECGHHVGEPAWQRIKRKRRQQPMGGQRHRLAFPRCCGRRCAVTGELTEQLVGG
jgi:hypothetical protein